MEIVLKIYSIIIIALAMLFTISFFVLAEITLIEFIREKRRLRKEMKVWQLSEIIYNIETHSNERCQKCRKWEITGSECPDICFAIETARYLTSKGVKVKVKRKWNSHLISKQKSY